MELCIAGQKYCYCNDINKEDNILTCVECQTCFHLGCLKNGRPSGLKGDIYFSLTCQFCSQEGIESCERVKLQWIHVVSLALYNLQYSGSGKCGYFRMKEDICHFIDKNWEVFYGSLKKKTSLWHGTVAGVLSNGCPTIFTSGLEYLKEQGWWKLTKFSTVPLNMVQTSKYKKSKLDQQSCEYVEKCEKLRSRRSRTSVIQAAVNLKARRSSTEKGICDKWMNKVNQSSILALNNSKEDISCAKVSSPEDLHGSADSSSRVAGCETFSSDASFIKVKREKFDSTNYESGNSDTLSHIESLDDFPAPITSLKQEITDCDFLDECNLENILNDQVDMSQDLDIDPTCMSPAICSPSLGDMSPTVQEMIDTLSKVEDNQNLSSYGAFPSSFDQTNSDNSQDYSVLDAKSVSETEDMDKSCKAPAKKMKKEYREKENENFQLDRQHVNNYKTMRSITLFEEKRLLERLSEIRDKLPPHLRRFRRKLLINQEKRAHNLPVFNLDQLVTSSVEEPDTVQQTEFESAGLGNIYNIPVSHMHSSDQNILDRFQTKSFQMKDNFVSFRTRLIGRTDSDLIPVCSPYTMRILKPFIYRDRESRPMKLRLLEEIIAHPHKYDDQWIPPERIPIDFCYVRPEHIPSINDLCRQFFWPGIDLSESLHYPDFTCVALYGKLVIAFAFLVPDLTESRLNEAYISFIFTHPDWRRAGIGSFMLYHLIQTCMGKDLTLHVSATNPAIMLYQKFGFKPEEYIIGFYDKYYSDSTNQCMNAYFFRLRR